MLGGWSLLVTTITSSTVMSHCQGGTVVCGRTRYRMIVSWVLLNLAEKFNIGLQHVCNYLWQACLSPYVIFVARKIEPKIFIACSLYCSGFTARHWYASARSCLLILAPLPATKMVEIMLPMDPMCNFILASKESGMPSLKDFPLGEL